LFEELPPVWLDPDAAKEAWRELEPQLDEQSFGGKAESNSDAVWVYAASLAIAGGDAKKGESILSKVSGQENWAVSLVQAELNFATDRVGQAAGILTTIAPKVSQSSRCWLALVQGKVTAKQMKPTDDNAALMLELLRGPALHAQDQPELAAGCLEQAIALTTIAEDSKSAQILKGELQRAFPLTVAARRNR
jgi:predicted Zn-dependent protease